MELLFIVYQLLVRLLKCKAVNNHPNNVAFFLKYQIVLDLLKDHIQIKRNYVKTFYVRRDAKHYRTSQGITGPMKRQFFSMIFFLNDSKFYDEERNKLSYHPLVLSLLRLVSCI